MLVLVAAACACAAAVCSRTPPRGDARRRLATEAERSGFVRTGRLDETIRLCRTFEEVFPERARCMSFGASPEGRPLLAIVASADGVLDAATARARRRPVIVIQAGIHAGEIDGKDGGFIAMRELLEGAIARDALRRATVVFVPVFNVDGHERFGPSLRPNQRGPVEAGFRTTAQSLNLNRDYVKAEAPEMHAMLALLNAWDPVVYVDLHTSDGAKFESDVAVIVEPIAPAGSQLVRTAQALSRAIQARLTQLGHVPVWFYPSFRTDDDPTSGFDAPAVRPRYSQGYAAARHRIGILVETNSWSTNRARIRSQRDVLVALLERAARDARRWRAASEAADRDGARLGGRDVTLRWKNVGPPRTIAFRGYAYDRRRSEISGGLWTIYDETRPQVWRVPLYDRLAAELVVRAPRGGYVVPRAHATWVQRKLRLHGIRFRVIERRVPSAAVEVFRAERVAFDPPFEGRGQTRLTGAWHREHRPIARGSLFVPIGQPRALIAMHLLEPQGPDSLATWGFFDASFERKEYMEAYVAEEEARKMLARDPSLRRAFERRLSDPAFAASPAARLDFFYRRHPSWDERVNLYPVMRVDAASVR